MPEHLSTPPLSHAQALREEAGRRLSRSPHPYHRHQFELANASERLVTASSTQSPLRSTQNTDDEGQETPTKGLPKEYRETLNSDSGTEADDEHFLKGLPAPRLRPHKGLRGGDTPLSSTPSPLLTPTRLDGQDELTRQTTRKSSSAFTALGEKDFRAALEKHRQKQKVEIVRRTTEAGILLLLGALLCQNRGVRDLIWQWRREITCEVVIIVTLILIYPIRLLKHINPKDPWKRPFPLEVPAVFDPAPLFYPPAISMLVSILVLARTPAGLLTSIILSIASLPRELIPSVGGLQGSNTTHWFISCLPLLISTCRTNGLPEDRGHPIWANIQAEQLVLVAPLHQALCVTLQFLTTTSLLEAELQLLSIGLIDLLILASSPQAVILKSLLWGGGIGLLISSTKVLKWGVALARVPKWRFRHAKFSKSRAIKSSVVFGKALFGKDVAVIDSGDEGDDLSHGSTHYAIPPLRLAIKGSLGRAVNNIIETGSVSAVDRSKDDLLGLDTLSQYDAAMITSGQRRHTMSTITSLPSRSSLRTPSGRRKRAASSSAQSFFHLTQSQATLRKWMYAAWVYVSLVGIIMVGIRWYIQWYALNGNEPIGWALGYLFGDIPWFRMKVVAYNLQRWICIPPHSESEKEASCGLGWVEHLRHASFGHANTRLILCAYWLAIIVVGLAIVFRLSSIYEVDTRRKVFHFMMVAMLLPATYVDPTFAALALSLMLAIFLLLDLFRASQLPPLSKSLAYFLTPYVDGRDLKGPVVISHIFLLIGCAIPLWLSLGALPRIGTGYLTEWEVPTREVSMVSGVICVGMGDAAASLIGRRYGRRKWLWGGGKSIEGSVAFAAAVGLALVLAKAWLRIGGWPANNDDTWFMTARKSSIAAAVASLTEAVLTGGNDNVVCPIVLWLCVKGLDI